jgi:diguanylate cyclase (GGDEF)-like protein
MGLFGRKVASAPSAPSAPAQEAPTLVAVPPPTSAGAGTEAEREAEQALDTLARLVRVFGRDAFALDERSVEEIEAHFEGWAQHLLMRRPPPGTDDRSGKLRFADLRAQLERHRRDEKSFVGKLMSSAKEAIWGMLQAFDQHFAEERESDARVSAQLQRLRRAAADGSIEDLKRTALETAETVAKAIAERQAAQRERSETLTQEIQKLGAELQAARQESELDPLTRLHNRRALDVALERAVILNGLSQRTQVMLLVDVDHFKRINDTRGHPAGDEVLKRLANCLVRSFPRKGDLVARYGGEEFCVLLGDASLDDAPRLADRLLRAVRALGIEWEGQPIPITASVGYSALGDGESAVDWLKRTDEALYAAKRNGRNRSEAAAPGGSVRASA